MKITCVNNCGYTLKEKLELISQADAYIINSSPLDGFNFYSPRRDLLRYTQHTLNAMGISHLMLIHDHVHAASNCIDCVTATVVEISESCLKPFRHDIPIRAKFEIDISKLCERHQWQARLMPDDFNQLWFLYEMNPYYVGDGNPLLQMIKSRIDLINRKIEASENIQTEETKLFHHEVLRYVCEKK